MEINTQPTTAVAAVSQNSLLSSIERILISRPIVLQILRFGAIGVFNTAMDVLVLNYMSAQFGVTRGGSIGWVNIPGFVLAVIQSYYWNKYWAFDNTTVTLIKNFVRLVAVGFVGSLVYGLVVLGAHFHTVPVFFLGMLGVFLIAQVVLWYAFGFFHTQINSGQRTYVAFYLVSIVGFFINTGTLYIISTYVLNTGNAADSLNLAKVGAIVVALIWNFIGYKLFVFRK